MIFVFVSLDPVEGEVRTVSKNVQTIIRFKVISSKIGLLMMLTQQTILMFAELQE